jgi:hypothetical protein
MVALQGACTLAVVGINAVAGVTAVTDSRRLPRHTCCCDVRDLCVVFAIAVGPAVAFAAINEPGVQLVLLLLIVFLLLLLLLLMTLVCWPFLLTWRPCCC